MPAIGSRSLRCNVMWLGFFLFQSRLICSPRWDDLDWINLPQHKRTTQRCRYIIKMPIYCNRLYLYYIYKSISSPDKMRCNYMLFIRIIHLSFWCQKFKHTSIATLTLSSWSRLVLKRTPNALNDLVPCSMYVFSKINV